MDELTFLLGIEIVTAAVAFFAIVISLPFVFLFFGFMSLTAAMYAMRRASLDDKKKEVDEYIQGLKVNR